MWVIFRNRCMITYFAVNFAEVLGTCESFPAVYECKVWCHDFGLPITRMPGIWIGQISDDVTSKKPILFPQRSLFESTRNKALVSVWFQGRNESFDRVMVCAYCYQSPSWQHDCSMCDATVVHKTPGRKYYRLEPVQSSKVMCWMAVMNREWQLENEAQLLALKA